MIYIQISLCSQFANYSKFLEPNIIRHYFSYGVHNMFVKCFQERQVWSQSK